MTRYRLHTPENYPTTVESWASATPFHCPRWSALIKDTLGIRTQHRVILANDKVVAYLPYHYGGLLGRRLRPGPALANYCPALIYDQAEEKALGEIHSLIKEQHPNALLASPQGDNSATSIFNLTINGLFDSYWEKQVHAKARYDVRKADKHEITTQFMDLRGAGLFYPLYLKRMRELGSPALPVNFFLQLAHHFKGDFQFAVSFKEAQPVAASTLLSYQGRWIGHPWSVSDTALRNISVNYAHYRDLIKYAFENDYSLFYLGPSLKDSNWSRIKKRFGADEEFAVRVDGVPSQHAANSSLVKTAQFVLRHLPVPIYNRLTSSVSTIAIKLLD